MAQVPSMYFHYEDSLQQSPYHTIPGTCPISPGSTNSYHQPFSFSMTGSSSSEATKASRYSASSPVAAKAAVSPAASMGSPQHCPLHYSENCLECFSYNRPPSLVSEHEQNIFYNDDNSLNSSLSGQSAVSNNFNKNFLEDDLEEPLNEIPMEALLQMTPQEGHIIHECEERERRSNESAHYSAPSVQTGEDIASPYYSSNQEDFILKPELDDSDSISYANSPNIFPLQATFDSQTISNHSSSPVPNNFSSSSIRSVETKLSSSLMISPQSNSNTQYSDSFYCPPSSNHSTRSSENMDEYSSEDSPNSIQLQQEIDCKMNFRGQIKQSLENAEMPHAKKKSKSDKTSLQSQKRPVKYTPQKLKDPPSKRYESPSNEMSDCNNQNLQQKTTRKADEYKESIDTSPESVFSPSVLSPSEPVPRVVRKRRRCPRGMTLEKKPCDVCGDLTKNMHFGGLVCDSCKAFFRRSVQSNTCEAFKCEKEENCVITKANRRSCQYCRFQKCRDAGMKMDWVMTEAGRINLLKNRLARTRTIVQEKEKEKKYQNLPRSLGEDDALAINNLLNTLHESFESIPYPKECEGDSIDTLSNIFVFLCKRFGKFFLKVTEGATLCPEDRTVLLKNGIAMSLYINGAHLYDPVLRAWPAESTHESVKIPFVSLETLQGLAGIPEAFSTIMNYYNRYEGELKDHVTAVLMYTIAFYSYETSSFLCPSQVVALKESYIGYLRRYLISRDGYESTTGVFLDLMKGLTQVKDILKYHAMVDIKPTINFLEKPQEQSKEYMMKCMGSLIEQIQKSLQGSFPLYSSVFTPEETNKLTLCNRTSLGDASSSLKCQTLPKLTSSESKHHHPNTIAIFGDVTPTDRIITQPLENIMEWENDRKYSVTVSPPSPLLIKNEGTPTENCSSEPSCSSDFSRGSDHQSDTKRKVKKREKMLIDEDSEPDSDTEFTSSSERTDNVDSVGNSKIDVDAVCDILKRLTHADNGAVFNAFKKNIPRELLENFSRSLSEEAPYPNIF